MNWSPSKWRSKISQKELLEVLEKQGAIKRIRIKY